MKFGVEKIILHSTLALIRLDRPIQFGPNLMAVCLPFGRNRIPEPSIDSHLTLIEWGTGFTKDVKNVTLMATDRCKKNTDMNETQI